MDGQVIRGTGRVICNKHKGAAQNITDFAYVMGNVVEMVELSKEARKKRRKTIIDQAKSCGFTKEQVWKEIARLHED
jgi:hypothetical protein